MSEVLPAQLLSAYRTHNARQLTRSVIGANIIAMIVVPGGATLDYFLYPEFFYRFLTIRLLDALFLLAMIGVLMIGWQRPNLLKAKFVGVVSAVSITAAISLMIFETEGAKSPYFAGVNLAIMCFASLLPWSVVQTIAMCVSTLVIYVTACSLNPTASEASFLPYLGFNVSFILIASTICVGITIFLSRVRFEDFRLRHKLDAQNRELQDLDRLKTQFFSNVSHELRTPLTLILGPVETMLARTDGLDSRVHEGLIMVQRNTLRLLKLINDLLELTRLDLGGEVLRKKALPVGTFVKGVVESVRYLGLSKRLKMRVEEGDDSVEVAADPTRLEKVLLNLLTNAIKYTPPGGAITLRWAGDEESISIEVEDTGVGIPAEDLPRVFDRFHQVRSNAANQNQGVGIGLALAKELIEQHDGRIDVESIVGKGTTFRVVLPREEVAAEPADEGEADIPPAADEPFEKAFRSADRAVRSFTEAAPEDLPEVGRGEDVILVADDENDMRQFIVSMLSDSYRIVQTSHGGNVVDLVAEHEPSLVLLDWMMPEKDGLEVCRELRADSKRAEMKIVLLTARVDEKSKIEALEAGADDFLTKPFSSVEVKTRVANLLRSGKLQRDLRVRNTELQETVEKLQRTEFMLIQSEKMNAIGSLSAGLLHEINNPLNYTLTAISVVHRFRDSLSEDMRELLADIEEGMIRIRDVITHLKTFAYPEKPGHESTFAVRDALVDARKIAAKDLDGITIDAVLPADLFVRGQKTQLTHVFINLLGNAAKALAENPNGTERRIRVGGCAEGDQVVIEVADNGPGIPPDVIGRVFEPFFTTREVGSGMGMGLSICHTILESHGGSIRVANGAEGGAIFTIEIPLAEMALQT